MKTNLIQDYKIFEGRYNEQMPLLVNGGLQPLTSKDVMGYRIKAIQSNDKDEIDFWLNHYWDTVTGLAYYKGNLIVAPNSQELLNITPESKLNNGGLVLTPDQYKKLAKEYEVIKRSKIRYDKSLTKEQAKQHPVWIKLAQEDRELLNEYVDKIFAKAKDVYGCDENMGIYLPDDRKNPELRGWDLGYLSYGSDADARYDLDGDNLRLPGVRAKNLEGILLNILKERKITNPNELKEALDWYRKKSELVKLVSQ
jgi:hypothetical protein